MAPRLSPAVIVQACYESDMTKDELVNLFNRSPCGTRARQAANGRVMSVVKPLLAFGALGYDMQRGYYSPSELQVTPLNNDIWCRVLSVLDETPKTVDRITCEAKSCTSPSAQKRRNVQLSLDALCFMGACKQVQPGRNATYVRT